MKQILMTMVCIAVSAIALAQEDDDWAKKVLDSQSQSIKEYEEFRQKALRDYDDFRKKANEEYAKFMAESWKFFGVAQPKEELPWQPKPPQPVVANPEDEMLPLVPQPQPAPEPEQKPDDKPQAVEPTPQPRPEPFPVPDQKPLQELEKTAEPQLQPKPIQVRPTSVPIPFDGEVRPVRPIEKQPQPIEPIQYIPHLNDPVEYAYFFGTPLPFHFDRKYAPHQLHDVSEKSVAALWTQLSDPYYDQLIVECLKHREERNLNDWAFIMLTQMVAETCCNGHTNESVVMHMYLLTQSGYQMRLGRAGNKLSILVGSEEKIYHYKYFVIDGVKYYNFDASLEDVPFSIFDHAFPKENVFSLRMTLPKLAYETTEPRTIVSKRYPDVSVTVEMNKNLIDFYNTCPLSAQWCYYSSASLSETVKETLYPALRKAIEGKTQAEAANIILNLIQTGFKYATDQDQFGYERPLFPDETFYYPFCDCEDRAILYSCLMRELLGLESVLLNYPGHLATAICFTDDIEGDYLNIDGKKYVICDPTYIGAAIGKCMPDLKTVMPKVERF